MAYLDWMLKTKRLVSCSCDYGCPCEFNAPPTRTPCEGVEGFEIIEGYFGDVRLDGIRFAGVYRWPGPVHEGGGAYMPIIDKGASEEQVAALFKIMSGEEQEPTTMFNIYGSTIDTEIEPVFTTIDFEWDLEARTGALVVPEILEAVLEPIRNPVTGAPHRALIRLPEGFEFRDAEMASSTFWSSGEITQAHERRYGFLTYAAYGPHGVIEEHSYPHGQAG
jgi:hypothetical protein